MCSLMRAENIQSNQSYHLKSPTEENDQAQFYVILFHRVKSYDSFLYQNIKIPVESECSLKYTPVPTSA